MRRIYTVLLYVLLPLILLRLYYKGKRLPAYRARILERFFIKPCIDLPVDVWLHAVSMGEVVAATPLIDALLANHQRILVTTMTPTGSQQVHKRFAEKVAHQYLPYDYPWVLRRFFRAIQAKIGIIMETELWPNMIVEAQRLQLPLVLVNARISDKAYPQYYRWRHFFRPLLGKFSAILTQSDLDAQRFSALSGVDHHIHVLGNMKFDIQTAHIDASMGKQLQRAWGQDRVVIVAASTHDDEESRILAHLRRLQLAIPKVLLILVPRHPERFQTVFALSQQMGFCTHVRTVPSVINTTTEVLVIDVMGELMNFYQVCDYAFVGGSFVPIGGHNVLEPIAMNVPVFCGPYMQNSQEICQTLLQAQALQQLASAEDLITAIIAQHRNGKLRALQVANASRVLRANQGTVQRYCDAIQQILERPHHERLHADKLGAV